MTTSNDPPDQDRPPHIQPVDQKHRRYSDPGSRDWSRIPRSTVLLHPTMQDYLDAMESRNRHGTALIHLNALRVLMCWLANQHEDPLTITTERLEAFQGYLATLYRSVQGKPLMRSSQGVILRGVKAYYRWLEERKLMVVNPARRLHLRIKRPRVVMRQHLTLQEATAFVQSQAQAAMAERQGSHRWAVEIRNLALLCVALSTGRRRSGLISLRVEHVDLERRELRCEREKGHIGRVLPVSGWAIDVLRIYLLHARPILVRDPSVTWLFVGRSSTEPMSDHMLYYCIQVMVGRTVAGNPDLLDLPGKRITWHSLRVSFATLLFANGCDIRSVNELLLHRLLSTTAQYTPIPVEDLRQVCRMAHPRA